MTIPIVPELSASDNPQDAAATPPAKRGTKVRTQIGKRRRFGVFLRDHFTCQYCGRKPPDITLEIDHIIAVANDGTSEDHNLITACFDCNRGKSSGSLEVMPIDVSARTALMKERMEQVKAYDKLLKKEAASLDKWIDEITEVFQTAFEGYTLDNTTRVSIRRFLRLLPARTVYEAMELACARMGDKDYVFRYFCGICWNLIRERGDK